MKTVSFILCGVFALQQNAGVTLPEICKAPTNNKPRDVAYADIWAPELLINAPSGCARPQKRCEDGSQNETRVPYLMLSGRGRWYFVGPECNGTPMPESYLTFAYVGNTFHLVDEGMIIAEHTVQEDDFFIQGLPCHKKTMDINCAREFVGKTPFIGMHVVCFSKNRVCAYRDASGLCELLEGEDLTTVEKIAHAMRLPPRQEGQNPMRFYTLDGNWVATVHGYFALLLFENGVFLWPPMETNYTRIVSLTDRNVHMVTRSITPPIFEIVEPMINESEIDQIVDLSSDKFAPSSLYNEDDSSSTKIVGGKIRTSSGTFLDPNIVDDHLFEFMRRIQSLIRIPLTHAEKMQVVKYEQGQFYGEHTDSFYFKEPHTHIKENRVVTFFTNFVDVEKGGGTGFQRARREPNVINSECANFEMPALKGKSIFWYNSYPNGVLVDASWHAGCEVKAGEKLASNFWFWDGYAKHFLDENHIIWMHDDRSVKASRPYFNEADNAFFAPRFGY